MMLHLFCYVEGHSVLLFGGPQQILDTYIRMRTIGMVQAYRMTYSWRSCWVLCFMPSCTACAARRGPHFSAADPLRFCSCMDHIPDARPEFREIVECLTAMQDALLGGYTSLQVGGGCCAYACHCAVTCWCDCLVCTRPGSRMPAHRYACAARHGHDDCRRHAHSRVWFDLQPGTSLCSIQHEVRLVHPTAAAYHSTAYTLADT